MAHETDILVLGATGFTGRLVTKQLNAHRDRASFTFALGARSSTKLAALVSELDLNAQIPLLTVDVTNLESVERVVKTAKVVINTVGPYWTWGTPVVETCVRHGVHYVDLTGETAWIKEIISRFDYAAFKTHAVIVPSCGFDSIPSDLSVYLSVRTLKERLGPSAEASRSVTSFKFRGGVSGGTLSSIYTYLTDIPRPVALGAFRDHSLSPAPGASSPREKLVYTMPRVRPQISGGFGVMSYANRAVVHRTRGLLEINESMRNAAYGPEFTYEEFFASENWFTSACMSLSIFSVGFVLASSSFVRWLFKKLVVDRVHGPSDNEMEKGFLTATNVTSSVATSVAPEKHAKSVLRIRGDPGYLCTTVMLAECAIALLDTSKLTPLAREGGILTPVTAFGDELVKRLEATERFKFESSILET